VAHELAEHAQFSPPVSKLGGPVPPAFKKQPGFSLSAGIIHPVKLRYYLRYVNHLAGGGAVGFSGINTCIKAAYRLHPVHLLSPLLKALVF